MSEREERRFVEIPRESVRLMAESTGLELSDEVAALLAEDVCYRLREATQVRTLPPVLPSCPWRPLLQGFIHQTYRPPTLCFREYGGGSPALPRAPLLTSWASGRLSTCWAASHVLLTTAPQGSPGRFIFTFCM